MSTRELAELACRIIAVALLAFTVVEIAVSLAAVLLPVFNNPWGSPGGMELGLVFLGMLFLTLPVGLRLGTVWFLWAKADWIARQMVPLAESRSRWPRLRSADLQVAGFACIGLYFFCLGVSQLGRFIGYVVVLSQEGRAIGEAIATEEFIGIAINLAIGIVLMVQSRKFVRFLYRFVHRSEGAKQPETIQVSADQPPA